MVLILHAEKRSLQDIDMSFLHQIGEELQEERKHQQTNMHSIHIGIGSDDDFVIAQFIQTVFNIQRRLQAIEFFVLIDHRLTQPVAVKRFTAQGENSLGTDVATLGDRPRCRQTLGDED